MRVGVRVGVRVRVKVRVRVRAGVRVEVRRRGSRLPRAAAAPMAVERVEVGDESDLLEEGGASA